MRADRLISILMLLQTRGLMTADDLAAELEVSPRTIYRDVEALSIAGVPVYTERGSTGGIALLDNYRTNLTGLTRYEVQSLFMFTVPGLFADLQTEKDHESAMLKLQATLPTPFRSEVERVQQRILLDPADWFQPPEPVPHLPVIQQAIWQCRRLKITYRRSDGEWVRRLVDPYGLVAKASIWYMVAVLYNKPFPYRVSRIEEADLTEYEFSRLDNFKLGDYWRGWCTHFEATTNRFEVQVRVIPAGIPLLAQTFGDGIHHLVTESSPPADDGTIVLPLTFASIEAACRQLLGFGPAVEVVSPPNLRALMHETAGQQAAVYRHI